MNYKVAGLAAMAIMLTALLFEFQQVPSRQEPGRLFEDLAAGLDLVDGIRLTDPVSGEEVALSRQQEGWLLESGYPADDKHVARVLIDLGELEIAEKKTSRQDYHSRLGLAESGEGAGTRIELQPMDQTLIVGNPGPAGGQFVRLAGETQTWLTRNTLDISASRMDWIDPVAVNVAASDVSSVEIRQADGGQLAVARADESGEWQVENVPRDRELRYPTVVDSLGRILVNLRFTDVTTFDESLFSHPNVTRVALVNGETIIARTVRQGEDHWLHLENLPDRADAVRWQYKISEFTYNELNKGIDDLLSEPAVE